jgi:hypothetical protein
MSEPYEAYLHKIGYKSYPISEQYECEHELQMAEAKECAKLSACCMRYTRKAMARSVCGRASGAPLDPD